MLFLLANVAEAARALKLSFVNVKMRALSFCLIAVVTLNGCSSEQEQPINRKALNDHSGAINEKQYVNGVQYTLESIRRQSQIDSSELGTVKPDDGLEYLVCRVTAIAMEDTMVMQGNLGLLDIPNERRIDQEGVTASFGPIDPSAIGLAAYREVPLRVGQSCTIYGVFEIPKNYPLKNLKVMVGDDFSNPEDYSLISLDNE